MRHALGKPNPWRNYFCASPGSANDAEWAELVAGGLAVLARKPDDLIPYNTYSVTEAGMAALKNPLDG